MKKLIKNENILGFASSLIAVIIGLLFGAIIIYIANPNVAFKGLSTLIQGGFKTGAKGIGQTLFNATPIIMTGLSVGFAFKTGLFNIGTPGQFVMGAFAAIYVGVKWTFLPSSIHWLVAILAAMIAGGIWAIIPGLMKAYLNTNEVIVCIIMNYIGMYTVNYLIPLSGNVYNSMKNQTSYLPSSAIIPDFGLNNLFPGANGGIIFAVIFVIIVHIILNKTTFGYELKACGFNKDASKYAGINDKKNIVLAMVIAGCLAGIGGALVYQSGAGKCLSVVDELAAEGFNGIPVALLGLSNPLGVLVAGLFIAHLNVGGFNMQIYGFIPEIVSIITSCIIYFSAFSMLIRLFLSSKSRGHKKEIVPIETEPVNEGGSV